MQDVPHSLSPPLDAPLLARWLAERGIAEGRVEDVRMLAGGTQNLLLRFRCGGHDLVLRRPPPRLSESDAVVRREALVLAALNGTAVPHPRLRGFCEDAQIAGGAFLVTDEVRGFNATIEMPGRAAGDRDFRRGMGLAMVDAIAALAGVSLARGQLATLGRTDGFVHRQARRWAAQLEGYAAMPQWAGADALGPVGEIGAWLDSHQPADYRPGLMHGDYHIGNVLFDAEDGRVAAILDWELTALGDPLLDLARLTTAWPNSRNVGLLSLKVEPWDGFPRSEELIERYAAQTGRPVSALPWFQVLACYKYAVILEGTHARAQAGLADPAMGARLHASARGLIAKAADLVQSL